MKINEYKAKAILSNYNVPAPEGYVASIPEQVVNAFREMGGSPCAIKAQILAGGRGKGGGIKIVKTESEAEEAAMTILGRLLATNQTGVTGAHVRKVLVEKAVSISKEFYLALVIDSGLASPVLMACAEGGVEIEEIAARSPEKIVKERIDPFFGIHDFQSRLIVRTFDLYGTSKRQLTTLLPNLFRAFTERDCTLLEINPLALTTAGDLCVLDVKMNIDDNALYRHPELASMDEFEDEGSLEAKAFEYGLSYIGLDGDIGCMVNGAGLAMATMDIIKLHGGRPANFLDVGGDAPVEKVRRAFELVLTDKKVKGVLVNIFGGIMKCDVIAEGIIQAVNEIDLKVPLVVRLDGTNVGIAKEMLRDSGLNIISADGMKDAAERIVRAVKG